MTVRRALAVGLPVAVVMGAFALAEALKALGVLPPFIPAPSSVLAEVQRQPKLLSANLGPTIARAVTGYAIAAAVALGAAAVASLVRVLYAPIYNLGVGIQSVPIIAAAPLLATALGTGPETQIIIAALGAQFPMLVGAMQGFRAADERHRELLHVLSATPRQTFRHLTLPAALPNLFSGFKIAVPAAVLGTITGEWTGAERGIGAMMLYALFSYDIAKVWLSVLIVIGLAAGGYALGALIERLVVYWDTTSELER